MTAENYDAFKLDAATSRAIYEEQIKPLLFKSAKPAEKPVFVLLGGQPGAGKSGSVEAATAEFAGKGGIVPIIGDDFRPFHPANKELMVRNDKTAALYTAADSGRWVETAALDARDMRANVLMETTLRRPELAAHTIGEFRKAGYTIDVRVLAVPHELSEQGVLMRYEGQKASRGSGRMTPPDIHQAAYDSLPESLRRIEDQRLADEIKIYRRGNEQIYGNRLEHGQWMQAPRAVDVVTWERERPWTDSEKAQYAERNEGLRSMLRAPARRASAGEIQQLEAAAASGTASVAQRTAAGETFAAQEARRLLGPGATVETATPGQAYYGRIIGETPTHWIQGLTPHQAAIHAKADVSGAQLGSYGCIQRAGAGPAAFREIQAGFDGRIPLLSRDGKLLTQPETAGLHKALLTRANELGR